MAIYRKEPQNPADGVKSSSWKKNLSKKLLAKLIFGLFFAGKNLLNLREIILEQ